MKRLYVIIPSILIFSVFLLLPNLTFADLGIESFIQRTLFGIVNAVFGFFVFLAALLLDFGINTFVIGFGDTFLSTGVGVAVNNTWVVVRDFVNLFFIFGFVYIGFKMILNSNDSNTRRWLVNIILAALLVNFSLFATKFVIDVSNQLAAQIAVNGLGEGSTVNPNTGLVEVKVGTEFADRMGIRSLLGTGQIEQVNGWGFIFGSAFLYLTAMFVFAAGGILLIIRFAMLNLFMVLSPLMFIGWVLPPLGDTMRRFWGMFIGRAFFAPIYFLFLYFSLQVLSGLQVSVGNFSNPNWRIFEKIDNTASVTSGNLGTIPFFILVCIFMVLSLVAANKLGADGGAKAVSLGKSFSNRVRSYTQRTAGAATFGVGARVGRNTVGRVATSALREDTKLGSNFRKFTANNRYGQQIYAATKKTAESSFDARKVGGMGKALGIGEGQKGGFAGTVKEDKKRRDEFVKFLGEADMDEEANKVLARREEERIKQKADENIKNTQSAISDIERVAEESQRGSTVLETEIKDIEKQLKEIQDTITQNELNPQLGASELSLLNQKTAELQKQKSFKASAKAISDKRKALTEKIEQLEFEEQNAQSVPELAEKLKTQREDLEKELKGIDSEIDSQITVLKEDIKRFQKEKNEAKQEAEAEIKFANQRAYLARLQASEAKHASWSKRLTGAATLGGALPLGAVLGLGGAAIGGADAGFAYKAWRDQQQIAIRELDKEYGSGGKKKIKKDSQKKKVEAAAAALVAKAETGDDEKKDEEKSGKDKDADT